MAAQFALSSVKIDKKAVEKLPSSDPRIRNEMKDWADTIADSVNSMTGGTTLGAGSRIVKADGVREDADGAYGVVVAVDPGWHLLEYGTFQLSPKAPIRRGVSASGAEFKQKS